MDNDLYCSMIHGGLSLAFNSNGLRSNNCCLHNDPKPVDLSRSVWLQDNLKELRAVNKNNKWAPQCENCRLLELSGSTSFRSGANQGLGIYGKTDLSGPARIDLLFDKSCNLACRTCGPSSSTFWQKHLQIIGRRTKPIDTPSDPQLVIDTLSKIDLSNLKMLVFCGGETLLGDQYWKITRWLADNVPNAQTQLTVCFQSNGTQPINSRYFSIIENIHLVKIHISLDGVGSRFDYLRWPAKWDQVVNNITQLRNTLPGNVMFVIEETVSIFNLYYMAELDNWTRLNFSTNKHGDVTNHTRHIAHGMFSLANLTHEYRDALRLPINRSLLTNNWQENPETIKEMIEKIKFFDEVRNESFEKTFPEVAEFYRRYL